KSEEWQELSGLLTTAYLPGPTVGGQYLSLLNVRTPDGKMVLAAAVFDDIYAGSNFIKITDKKLLAKLRNIKGQFHNVPGTGDLPVFYYEYLMSTADFKVFSKTGVLSERTFRKIPTIEKECPEKMRLFDEIMKLLIKRQTSLADGSAALTTVMLNALKANSGGEKANEFDLLLSHYSEEVRKFSESMKRDRFCGISRKNVRSVSVKRLWHRIGQALARAGTNLRNKLGHGGGLQGTMVDKERPERVRHLAVEISDLLNKRRPNLGDALNALNSVMLTAIEANYGREKANEYDLLNAQFSEEVRRFSGGRVQ
ncbi:MAG: hypothetical protein WCB94_01370, partial [Terriglobales bacterium]